MSTVFAMLFRINTSLIVVKHQYISWNWVDDHKKKDLVIRNDTAKTVEIRYLPISQYHENKLFLAAIQ